MKRSVGSIYLFTALLISFVTFAASGVYPRGKPSPEVGKSIYEARCVLCHGKEGKGNGPAAALLHPRPRDFTTGTYKFRSTESGSIPTDSDLVRTITKGLHGTSMPDWAPFIKGDSLSVLVSYVKLFSARFTQEIPKEVTVGRPVPSSPMSIAAGRKVFEKLDCSSCHGTDGTGKNATATDLQDDWGYPVSPPNLTEWWTFKGGADAKEIYLRVRTGISGSPMPSYVGSASGNDLWNLANYIISLRRKPVWEMNAQEVEQLYASLDRAAKADPVKRGHYLVETIGCGACHTPVREDGTFMEELHLAGGQRWSTGPYGEYFSRNLTSDKETGLGNWTDAEIKQAMTRGIGKDGRRFLPFTMIWTSLSNLKNEDVNAIIAYLRTLPPVYNKIPDPKPLNVFSYLWGKFKMLILREDFGSRIYPGNAGTPKNGQEPMAKGE